MKRGRDKVSILSVSNVSYFYKSRYQTVQAVKSVSCEFEEGKTYAIVGKSGCGKTTLLSLLAALDLPTDGSILYQGTSTANLDRDKYRRNDVTVIYQSFNLFPLLNGIENVMYPMELNGINSKLAEEKAKELIIKVGLTEKVFKQFPRMLSGGEQQRIAVARALASNAKVVLADEPTGNLDSENGQNVVNILKALAHNEGYCIIVVTHDLDIACQLDVTLHMSDGKMEVG